LQGLQNLGWAFIYYDASSILDAIPGYENPTFKYERRKIMLLSRVIMNQNAVSILYISVSRKKERQRLNIHVPKNTGSNYNKCYNEDQEHTSVLHRL
jgi:hypothetical protein